MDGITNLYIERLLSRFETNFMGVFSSDNIPYFPKYNASLICNLSKTNEKGSHFIGIYITETKILYFDPFGVTCYVQSISKYLQLYNREIIESLATIQDPLSLHCGYFCIGFVLAINNNYTILMFQKMFSYKQLEKNDNIVCDFIIDMMK